VANFIETHSEVLKLLHGERKMDSHGEASRHIFAIFDHKSAKIRGKVISAIFI
jgi:hypothetical protein